MRHVIRPALIAGVLLSTLLVSQPALSNAVHDGNWTVLVITEKGKCDRGYRYEIKVVDGHVHYAGTAAVNLDGTVTPTGVVSVSIRAGDQGADGTGRLSDASGAGTWRGRGSSGACIGRWEAERR
jgi:hypothetical protein